MYVLPFEALHNNPNEVVTRLLNIMGAPIVYEGKLPVSNPSLSKKGLELTRFGNTILNQKERSLLRNFLQENFPKAKEDGFDLFTDEQREILIDFYRQSNQTLFNYYIVKEFKTVASTYL
ncbi:hypothetical protein DSCOOX_10400 [Desulfosarcina ovata subsp. ovata]|uniref:Uncharacterized protein n=1 Tax=Desulfosarcina ovata subsp. ovata TaxID=2752305 RepID=A0A5K8A6T2_9BACT|nr:hypothetical protein DSCOOX_10400 [Desulfosarcina ovata subsp. ovata]